MKILVTGGAGFIGTNLCKALVSDDNEVFCIDNFYSSQKENVADLLKFSNFQFIEHDILFPFPAELSDVGFDQIYHLACPASPPKYQKDHVYTLKVNFDGTLNVLNFAAECMRKFSKKVNVLFTSTSEIYGDPKQSPQNETYRGNVNPHGIRSCYDEGKRVAESLCMNYARQYKLPVKIVRIFNTYGPFMDKNDGRAVSNFIFQALKGENLTIYGDGKQTRSFQYIDDLISGITKYMNLVEDFPGPINFGNPEEVTVIELAQRIIQLINPDLKLDFHDLPKDDPLMRCPDISLAKEKLDWEPKINLADGLEKTIEYFRSIV